MVCGKTQRLKGELFKRTDLVIGVVVALALLQQRCLRLQNLIRTWTECWVVLCSQAWRRRQSWQRRQMLVVMEGLQGAWHLPDRYQECHLSTCQFA